MRRLRKGMAAAEPPQRRNRASPEAMELYGLHRVLAASRMKSATEARPHQQVDHWGQKISV
jgi:hypothetical protein